MILGILSETHGSVVRTKAAIKLLKSKNIGTVLHCGDIGSEGVLIELIAELQSDQIPFYAVLGNVDFDDEYQHLLKPGEFDILGRFADLTLAEKRLAIIHGDHMAKLQDTIASGQYDYVFTGHTHVKEDRHQGNTRVINPGAVYRASQPSVAVLDLEKDDLEFLPIV